MNKITMEHSANKRQGKNRASKPGEPKPRTTSDNLKESKKSSLKEKRKNPETHVRTNRKRKQPLPQSVNTIDKYFLPSTSNETPGPSKAKKGALQQQKPTGKKETPTDFFENKKDIATTKHGILSNYLGAWLSILSRDAAKLRGRLSYSRLVYVDGFAGPGRYKESGDTGSPLVAYTLALTHTNLPEDGPEIDMIFIEQKKNFSLELFENLKKTQAENLTAKNFLKVKYMVINAKFKPAMHWMLSNNFTFKEDGFQQNVPLETSQTLSQSFVTTNTPLFVFVDPFGYNGEDIPMTLMQKILQTTRRAEILINLMTGFLQRFLEVDSRERAINLLVGQHEKDSSWKPIVLQPENDDGIKMMKAFVDHYRKIISEQNPTSFVAVFEMRNNMNHLLYNLLYVCQHIKGFIEIKKAMRKCSQSDINFKYSSFEAKKGDLKRETVVLEALKQDIFHHFNADKFQGQVIVGRQITEFINSSPAFYQHYRNELAKLLKAFRTDENTSGRPKFDEMTFKFVPPVENDSDS